MLDTYRTKQCIAWSDISCSFRNSIPSGTSGNEIDFITIVRNLRTIGRSRRRP